MCVCLLSLEKKKCCLVPLDLLRPAWRGPGFSRLVGRGGGGDLCFLTVGLNFCGRATQAHLTDVPVQYRVYQPVPMRNVLGGPV